MQSYQEMSREELLREKESLEQQYKEICKKGLKLDMSRGKPSKEQLELPMQPLAIKRVGSMHNSLSTKGSILSASAIRQMLLNQDESWQRYVPAPCAAIIANALTAGKRPAALADFTQSILLLLRRSTPEALSHLPEVGEGLENRLWQAAAKATDLPSLTELVKSKRYTYTRLQRLLCYLLLGLHQDDLAYAAPLYLRVLGFDQKGQKQLRLLKKSGSLPQVVKTAQAFAKLPPPAQAMLSWDLVATDVYALASGGPGRQDFYQSPVLRLD